MTLLGNRFTASIGLEVTPPTSNLDEHGSCSPSQQAFKVFTAHIPTHKLNHRGLSVTQKKPKFYVVWQGRAPGVYTTWDARQAQINGFSSAKYKSFETLAKANAAYQQEADQHWGKSDSGVKKSATPP